jgi:prepilin-type N-terminal cleavage/methylation domain-containing protein
MKIKNNQQGFSIIELMMAMTVTLVILSVTMSLFSGAFSTRKRESRKTDALTSARAALNIISREIANSGYGLSSNGIITGDSNDKRIHFRSNLDNSNGLTEDEGEDVTYFFDGTTQSIVRHAPNDQIETSVIVNRISDVTFVYWDYTGNSSTATQRTTPTNDTGRVTITVTVRMEDVEGQPSGQTVTYSSDVTIRNSDYMLNQY